MNDKFQKALNRIVKSSCPNCHDENGCTSCDIEKICNATAKYWVDTLQELVDQNKVYILEEVKKMWEELGYEWCASNNNKHIVLLKEIKNDMYNGNYNKIISINSIIKKYACYIDESYSHDAITYQEHQLLNKTLRALGWL